MAVYSLVYKINKDYNYYYYYWKRGIPLKCCYRCHRRHRRIRRDFGSEAKHPHLGDLRSMKLS